MSGLELLPKAKALRPDVPVIMIIAYAVRGGTPGQRVDEAVLHNLTEDVLRRAGRRAGHLRRGFPISLLLAEHGHFSA